MPLLYSILYASSALILAVSAALVYRAAANRRLNQTFALTVLSLEAWIGTLFILFHSVGPISTLVGRINFAAIAVAACLGFIVICQLVGRTVPNILFLLAETGGLVTLTLLTPLIDAGEFVRGGIHVTQPGLLFPLFVCHIVLFLISAIAVALRVHVGAPARLRRQLGVIGLALAVSGTAIVATGVVLPYVFGDFRFEEVGALSVTLLASAIAYSIVVQRLFDVRAAIKRALVVTILVAFVEQAYSESVGLLLNQVPASMTTPGTQHVLTVLTVLLIYSSFHPLRVWLEKRLDRILRHHRLKKDEL